MGKVAKLTVRAQRKYAHKAYMPYKSEVEAPELDQTIPTQPMVMRTRKPVNELLDRVSFQNIHDHREREKIMKPRVLLERILPEELQNIGEFVVALEQASVLAKPSPPPELAPDPGVASVQEPPLVQFVEQAQLPSPPKTAIKKAQNKKAKKSISKKRINKKNRKPTIMIGNLKELNLRNRIIPRNLQIMAQQLTNNNNRRTSETSTEDNRPLCQLSNVKNKIDILRKSVRTRSNMKSKLTVTPFKKGRKIIVGPKKFTKNKKTRQAAQSQCQQSKQNKDRHNDSKSEESVILMEASIPPENLNVEISMGIGLPSNTVVTNPEVAIIKSESCDNSCMYEKNAVFNARYQTDTNPLADFVIKIFNSEKPDDSGQVTEMDSSIERVRQWLVNNDGERADGPQNDSQFKIPRIPARRVGVAVSVCSSRSTLVPISPKELELRSNCIAWNYEKLSNIVQDKSLVTNFCGKCTRCRIMFELEYLRKSGDQDVYEFTVIDEDVSILTDNVNIFSKISKESEHVKKLKEIMTENGKKIFNAAVIIKNKINANESLSPKEHTILAQVIGILNDSNAARINESLPRKLRESTDSRMSLRQLRQNRKCIDLVDFASVAKTIQLNDTQDWAQSPPQDVQPPFRACKQSPPRDTLQLPPPESAQFPSQGSNQSLFLKTPSLVSSPEPSQGSSVKSLFCEFPSPSLQVSALAPPQVSACPSLRGSTIPLSEASPQSPLQVSALLLPFSGASALPPPQSTIQPSLGASALPPPQSTIQAVPGASALPPLQSTIQAFSGASALPPPQSTIQPFPGTSALLPPQSTIQPFPGASALPSLQSTIQPFPGASALPVHQGLFLPPIWGSTQPLPGVSAQTPPQGHTEKTAATFLQQSRKFCPSTQEFKECPILFAYKMKQMYPSISLCGIKPPPDFKPLYNSGDNQINFKVSNQYIHRMLSRWGTATRQLTAIRYIQDPKIQRSPLFEGLEVDLVKLFHTVQSEDGIEACQNNKDKWQVVARKMKLFCRGKANTKLENIYLKYLLSYNTLTSEEREKANTEVEKCWATREIQSVVRAQNPLWRQERMQNGLSINDNESLSHLEKVCAEAEECVTPGRTMNYISFQRLAQQVQRTYFPNKQNPKLEQVERQFWSIVMLANAHVCVHSASVDATEHSCGFTEEPTEPYGDHLWNLKRLRWSSSNLLSHLGPALGVSSTSTHYGMMFSTRCWHMDPTSVPWIEYHHSGPPKIWYSISADQEHLFRAAAEAFCPFAVQNKSIWLPSDIMMIPPRLLQQYNITVKRSVQYAGEFIIIYPNTYCSCIDTGLTISEGVYFAPQNWLMDIERIFVNLRNNCEPSLFSMEKLLIAMGEDENTPCFLLQRVHTVLTSLLYSELSYRRGMVDRNIELMSPQVFLEQNQRASKASWQVQNTGECAFCRCHLHLSRMVGVTEGQTGLCAMHGIHLFDNAVSRRVQLNNVYCIVLISNAELYNIINAIKDRMMTSIGQPI